MSATPAGVFKNGTISSYYNYDKLYSYNGIYNFAVGGRGIGKTYGAQKKTIKAALEKGEQFMYVRRYKDELKLSRDTYFDAVAVEFPEWDFRTQGLFAHAAPASTRDDKKRPWQVIGYFVALSQQQQIKSVAFPKVHTIIYDEFIIEKGSIHYISNEAISFQNLYSTVDRYQGRVRVLFLANSVSMDNPYFIHYKIRPDQSGEWLRLRFDPDTGLPFIVVHFIESEAFTSEVFATRFGKFIQGTEYAEYAVGNEFADANDNLVAFKPSHAKYEYSVETVSGIFSVWIDWNGPYYYMQEKRPKEEKLFTVLTQKMREGKTLLVPSDKLLQALRTAFRNGNAYFDSPRARNAFIEIFKR